MKTKKDPVVLLTPERNAMQVQFLDDECCFNFVRQSPRVQETVKGITADFDEFRSALMQQLDKVPPHIEHAISIAEHNSQVSTLSKTQID